MPKRGEQIDHCRAAEQATGDQIVPSVAAEQVLSDRQARVLAGQDHADRPHGGRGGKYQAEEMRGLRNGRPRGTTGASHQRCATSDRENPGEDAHAGIDVAEGAIDHREAQDRNQEPAQKQHRRSSSSADTRRAPSKQIDRGNQAQCCERQEGPGHVEVGEEWSPPGPKTGVAMPSNTSSVEHAAAPRSQPGRHDCDVVRCGGCGAAPAASGSAGGGARAAVSTDWTALPAGACFGTVAGSRSIDSVGPVGATAPHERQTG